MANCFDPVDSALVRQLTHQPQRGPHGQRMAKALVVVRADRVWDRAVGVVQVFQPLAEQALVFERSDHAFDHAILLRAVGGDDLLLQAIAPDQCRGAAAEVSIHPLAAVAVDLEG